MLAIEDIVERVRIKRGWSRQTAAKLTQSYALFLSDCNNRGKVPSEDVDAIWHEHILHTRRYREDCLALIGHFVDHQPHAKCLPSVPEPRSTDMVHAECSAEGPAEPPGIVGAECSKPAGPPGIVRAECSQPEEPSPPPAILIRAECTKPAPEPPPSIVATTKEYRRE